MKILSLNVNDFGGTECLKEYTSKNRWGAWRALDKTPAASAILAYLRAESPEVAVLQEFELNTDTANDFIERMAQMGYSLVPYIPNKYKYPSVTLLFSKLPYEKLQNPHQKGLRAGVIRFADCIVYGVHVPMGDLAFWDELITFYQKHRDDKLLIIGDFNVYSAGTVSKEKYLKLLNLGAKDAWTEKGCPHETPTFKKGTRIDYAILSPSYYECLKGIQIDPALMDCMRR